MRTHRTWSWSTEIAALAVTLLLACGAQAGNIQQVTASPASVVIGEEVEVNVLQGGTGNCGAKLLFGDNTIEGPFFFSTNPRVFAHSYSLAGTYTITAAPQSLGIIPECSGSAMTTIVTVTANPNALQRAPARSDALQRIKPKATQAPSRRIRPLPPRAERETDRQIRKIPPQVHSVHFVPSTVDGHPFQAGAGILAPGGRLELNGVGFGNAGTVWFKGWPQGLLDVQWSGNKVVGTVPDLGREILKRYSISVQLTVLGETDEETEHANAMLIQYEVPHEIRVLTMDDDAVELVSCGMDGNVNQCQRLERGSNCGGAGADFLPPPQPTPTIYGRHFNCFGAVGNDFATDRYRIRLKNGWKLHELLEDERRKTSGDERIDALAFEKGADYGDYDLKWVVSPNDSVRYWYRMSIIGRMGTSHH